MEYSIASEIRQELRKRAEKKFLKMTSAARNIPCREDAEQQIQELQLRKIELEMENEDLRRSRRQWEKAFDAMHDMIIIQDQEMRIVRANKAVYTFFQTRPGELDGKRCFELFTGASTPCPDCPLMATLLDREEHSAIIHHQNLGKIFEIFAAVIPAEDGGIQYIFHQVRDITGQKKMEEKFLQARKMEAMGTLAGGIAHNFNNIFQMIIGHADLARRDLPADSMSIDHIDQVIKSTMRAADLVQQILTISCKADRQRHPIQPHLILQEALKLLRVTLPASITLEEHIDPDCGSILADLTSVHQIVMSLCTNGWQAMEDEKGVLTVTLSRTEISREEIGEDDVPPGPFIQLSVRDTGCGMDGKTMARIFEPYFTTREMTKGSGLGLAVVHGMVKALHGFIEVESKPGTGSTFHVFLPAEPVVSPAETVKTDFLGGAERILVVDDDPFIADLNKSILERSGYTVTVITSSEEALAQVCLHPDDVDLVLTDQIMPNLSGLELAMEIRKIRPELPIILCSGYSSAITEEEALTSGIKKYVMKPVDIKTLTQLVREVLDEG
jgi:PAS domain S-box-containing protein